MALLDVFETVNVFYQQEEKRNFFNISIAGVGEHHLPVNDYKIYSLDAVVQPDLILIPAFTSGNMAEILNSNAELIPWLHQQYSNKVKIASFCTGAFLLAASGLLNGKLATTHVLATTDFKKIFPQVLLQENNVITDDQGIFTSGGATSSFHLMLYLIEIFCGREIAVKISKFFAIDMDRKVQSYFSSFQPAKVHHDGIISIVQEKMESEYSTISTVDELINDLPVSHRNFLRRFKSATGVTPIDYLQKIRIEAAKKILENTSKSITEVMMDVGYSDVKAFRHLFRRITGLTPKGYQDKFKNKTHMLVAQNKYPEVLF